MLGLQPEALAFHSALKENTRLVSSRTLEYWRRAAERALNIRPDLEVDDEEDDSVGPKFLREFEQEERKKCNGQRKMGQLQTKEEGGEGKTGSGMSPNIEDRPEADPRPKADEFGDEKKCCTST